MYINIKIKIKHAEPNRSRNSVSVSASELELESEPESESERSRLLALRCSTVRKEHSSPTTVSSAGVWESKVKKGKPRIRVRLVIFQPPKVKRQMSSFAIWIVCRASILAARPTGHQLYLMGRTASFHSINVIKVTFVARCLKSFFS